MSKFDNIRAWAHKNNIFKKRNSHNQYLKLLEKVEKVKNAIHDKGELHNEIGEAIVALVLLAEINNIKIEYCIDTAINTIVSLSSGEEVLAKPKQPTPELKLAIEEHNKECEFMCENNSSCNKKNGYPNVRCVDCAKKWRIEL